MVEFVTKTTCEIEELGLDPKADCEERETPQPRVFSADIQTDSPQSLEDDGEKHPKVTPQASSSGKYPTRERRSPGYLRDYTREDSDGDDSTLTSIDYCYRAVYGVPLT